MYTAKNARVEVTPTQPSEVPRRYDRLTRTVQAATRWLAECLALRRSEGPERRIRLAAGCAGIFLLAFGVRVLHWQDSYSELEQKGQWMSSHARHYKTEALRILKEGGILFPRGFVDPGDARMILHPPGYSALIAGIYFFTGPPPRGEPDFVLTLVQIIFDALSGVMIILIAAEFFHYVIATVAGALASLSPHFAHYSLWTSPDTLCVLPILVAVYLTIKTIKRPRLLTIIGAGAMVGLSCWLRANALLIAPFLAVAVYFLIEPGKRRRTAAAFIGATITVVMPITLRNWILFHHFIPISIAGGENLVVGIADFDKEGRFGMPTSDDDVGVKEAVWYNRPDYANSLWLPDGVERDQARYARGLEVIKANPRWFLGIVLQRALFMLRYNDFSRPDWPFNTSKVPIVSVEPAFLHKVSNSGDTKPEWSSSAAEMLGDGSVFVSRNAHTSVDAVNGMLRIDGDDSQFGDQFASPPLAVKPRSDYLLTLQVAIEHEPAAAKVTSTDLRIALASDSLAGKALDERERERNEGLIKVESKDAPPDTGGGAMTIPLTFATGNRNEVRFVISNNGAARPMVTRVGKVELLRLGDTPYRWTHFPRAVIHGLQKNLFKTGTMLPMVIAGLLLLTIARKGRALVVLLAVPAYYLVVQSALSTEYRYILAIHYFLFVLAAVTIYCLVAAITKISRLAVRRSATAAGIGEL